MSTQSPSVGLVDHDLGSFNRPCPTFLKISLPDAVNFRCNCSNVTCW